MGQSWGHFNHHQYLKRASPIRLKPHLGKYSTIRLKHGRLDCNMNRVFIFVVREVRLKKGKLQYMVLTGPKRNIKQWINLSEIEKVIE